MHKRTMIQSAGMSLLGVLLSGAMPLWAAQQAAEPPETVSVQGVQVAIDPTTGRLREPTAAERAALSQALLERARQRRGLQASGSGGTAFVRPLTVQEAQATTRKLRLRSGVEVTGVDVPQSLVSSLVAEQQADGSLRIQHQSETTTHAEGKASEVTQ